MGSGLTKLWEVMGPLAGLGAVCCLTYLVMKGAGKIGGGLSRWVWPAAVRRPVALLSFILACASSGSSAAGSNSIAAIRHAAKPPWSGTSGSPPPLPLVPTEVPALERHGGEPHPAIHGEPRTRGQRGSRLFARAGNHVASTPAKRPPWEKTPLQRSDPAAKDGPKTHLAASGSSSGGRNQQGRCCARHYVVQPGDTLWEIAAAVLGTDSPRRVARYWPRVHRSNRAVIGPDPNLIRPGQVLELPEEVGF